MPLGDALALRNPPDRPGRAKPRAHRARWQTVSRGLCLRIHLPSQLGPRGQEQTVSRGSQELRVSSYLGI